MPRDRLPRQGEARVGGFVNRVGGFVNRVGGFVNRVGGFVKMCARCR